MAEQEYVIQIENLTKVYQMGEVQVHALRGVSFTVTPGEVLAIMGPSGSGKSTLMNMLGCLDTPTAGDYYLDGERVSTLVDDALAEVRNRKIGFVFQQFNLLPRATALANVELPLRYSGMTGNRKALALTPWRLWGWVIGCTTSRMSFQAVSSSGWLSRALVNSPAIILADEPTGNLDTSSGEEIINLLLS